MFYNNKKTKSNSQNEKNNKIQEIYRDEMNNECFDCGKPNPDFISANNGIFICKECMAIHYQFSDDISLIIKNNLFLLNEEQINYIYFGGNRKLLEFINYEFPQLQNFQPEILYKTQALQYYRDNLYYMVEGGNKPVKPDEKFAYKLITNYVNYPMTEKREKYYNNINLNNINNMNNNLNNNYKIVNTDVNYYGNDLNCENVLEEEEDDINSNLNINNNYPQNEYNGENDINGNNNNENINLEIQQNNSYDYNQEQINNINDEKTLDDFKEKRINVREPENINFLTNENSKSNFYQRRDNFFKEMNRLFGGSGLAEDEEEKRNINTVNNFNSDIENTNSNNKFYQVNNSAKRSFIKTKNRTYKAKRPNNATNYNYNNYIKNTININNNNTNIYFDEERNLQMLTTNQNGNNSQDNIKNIDKYNNKNYSGNFIIYNKNLKIEPIKKPRKLNAKNRINIHVSKKVYIKPKLTSFNSSNSKSPSITVNDNNYNSMPNTESIKNKSKQIIISSDNVEIENMDEPIKKRISYLIHYLQHWYLQ